MTSNGKDFKEMLERIGYPSVKDVESSNFDWMFENEDLKLFVQSLCNNLTQKNALTAFEVEKYKKLEEDETIDQNELEKSCLLLDELDSFGGNTIERAIDLETKIDETKKENKILEFQKANLRTNYSQLLEEKEFYEKQLKNYEVCIRSFEMEGIPNILQEHSLCMFEACKLLKIMLVQYKCCFGTFDEEISPKMFVQIDNSTENYLKIEEQLSEGIHSLLKNNYSKTNIDVNDTNNYKELLCIEETQGRREENVSYLRRMMPVVKLNELKYANDIAKLETEIQSYENLFSSKDFSKYTEESLKFKKTLSEKQNVIQRCLEQESQLINRAECALSTLVQSECDHVPIMCTKERFNEIRKNLDFMKKLLDALLKQKSNLEFLSMCLASEEIQISKMIQNVRGLAEMIKTDSEHVNLRLERYSEKTELKRSSDEPLVSSSISCVLEGHKYADQKMTVDQACQEIQKLREFKIHLNRESKEIHESTQDWFRNVKDIVSELEQHTVTQESSLICPSVQIKELNATLAELALKIENVQSNIIQILDSYEKKKKIYHQDRHTAMSRDLFKYALTRPELAHKAAEYIEKSIEKLST